MDHLISLKFVFTSINNYTIIDLHCYLNFINLHKRIQLCRTAMTANVKLLKRFGELLMVKNFTG